MLGALLILFFFSWLDVLPPVALIPPGDEPALRADSARPARADAARGDARRVDADGARRDDRDAARGLRPDGAAERLPRATVVSRYALRNALAPSVQVFAQNIQYLIGGIIVVEYLFAYSGDRQGARRRASAIRDVRDVQSIAILIAAIYIGDQHRRRPASSSCSRRSSGRRREDGSASSRTKTGHRRARPAWLSSSGSRCSGRSSRRTRPTETIATPFEDPSGAALLGTDELGRDVLSRVLWGGRSVLGLAVLATVLAYAGGLVDRPRRRLHAGWLDGLLMRGADVLLSFPALLFILVIVTGAGTSTAVLVATVAVVQMPLIASDHPDGDARAVRPRLRRGGRGAGRAAARDPPARDPPEHRLADHGRRRAALHVLDHPRRVGQLLRAGPAAAGLRTGG